MWARTSRGRLRTRTRSASACRAVGQNQTYIAGIYGTQLANPAYLEVIDANGQLGTILTPPLQTGSGTIATQSTLLQRLNQEQAINDAQREMIANLERRLAQLERQMKAGTPRKLTLSQHGCPTQQV
jgi:hypothetical protein